MKNIVIACFGDVCGKIGRTILLDYLKKHSNEFDFIIVNAENAAHGFGINQKICDEFFNAGVHVITLGNHTFDQKSDMQIFDRNANLIRPLNYPIGTLGHGFTIITEQNHKVMVVNLIGRLFMELNDDPFTSISKLLEIYKLGVNVDSIIIDFHAEASSEKVALAHYLDGKVSCIFGTHTHVPTADAQILYNGTGFISDCGMCGDYNSVIGMEANSPILRFTDKMRAHSRLFPASNISSACVCGVVFELNRCGKCEKIKTIRSGGNWLKEQQEYL